MKDQFPQLAELTAATGAVVAVLAAIEAAPITGTMDRAELNRIGGLIEAAGIAARHAHELADKAMEASV